MAAAAATSFFLSFAIWSELAILPLRGGKRRSSAMSAARAHQLFEYLSMFHRERAPAIAGIPRRVPARWADEACARGEEARHHVEQKGLFLRTWVCDKVSARKSFLSARLRRRSGVGAAGSTSCGKMVVQLLQTAAEPPPFDLQQKNAHRRFSRMPTGFLSITSRMQD